MLDQLGKTPFALARLRGLDDKIIKAQMDEKILMEGPASAYAPGLIMVKEYNTKNIHIILNWMQENKKPHPNVPNFLLGMNHGHHTNLECMKYFKDRPQIAKRFEYMAVKVLRWPSKDLGVTEEVIQAMYAVSCYKICFFVQRCVC